MLLMTLLVSAALAAVQSGEDPGASDTAAEPANQISKAEAEAVLANCGKRRFETAAVGEFDGKMRRTRLNLCAADDETNEEWIAKLERTAVSVESQPALPDTVKQKLLADLRAEIARLKGPVVVAPVTADIAPRARPLGDRPSSDFQVSPLPDLPPPPPPRPALDLAGPITSLATSTPDAAPPPDAEEMPVVDSGTASSTGSDSAVTIASAPATAGSDAAWAMIRCRAPGDPTTGTECTHMVADTVLLITALRDIPARSVLRFARSDGARTEQGLAASLGRGQRLRLKLPKPVCARILRTELTIDLLVGGSDGTPSDTERHGPFRLGC